MIGVANVVYGLYQYLSLSSSSKMLSSTFCSLPLTFHIPSTLFSELLHLSPNFNFHFIARNEGNLITVEAIGCIQLKQFKN
ncbi:hypothetical protein NQ318_014535 [Aromia moschata]|uniref:Uncharacterized protein n=1 Tax=Aromia moschata TaxID=1265417 RepID=A0AAV8X6A7_9CUCU|nr:hypothetical protein NQ318_014535 [Aromia moschata]